ncbi:hypothetical protein MASR2M32_14730 [Sphaerotilus sulfidivorans]|jgi:hypothetical protein|uniref:DUF2726 domain-containing protein n=1 Tax=Sphaerotilus TaxID=34102 RepID=UPI001C81D3AE|nr:DUF2726 domain-containing protein [Sphaerotilus sp. FB-3]GIX52539.1 hypothetical protein CQA4T8M7_17950 [Sphaerotilus natans]GKQ58032.1 hypothetical protein QMTAC487_18920 [Sphaerotilus sp. FB-3]
MPIQVWILALAAIAGIIGLAVLVLRRSGAAASGNAELPTEWPLTQRPIFSPEERALYRQLRTALPHHMILAKLPLVRFCQPEDREELRYWFNLLGPIHVSFVVCADNGKVLAAVDIERPSRPASKRTAAIKLAVLDACRVRYVRCRADQLPTAAELQLLVPASGDSQRPAVPGSPDDTTAQRRSTLANAVRNGAPANGASSQWYESGFSHDSFFAPETQRDPFDDSPRATPAGAPNGTGAATGNRSWAGQSTSKFNPGDFGPPGDAAGDIVGKR